MNVMEGERKEWPCFDFDKEGSMNQHASPRLFQHLRIYTVYNYLSNKGLCLYFAIVYNTLCLR